MKEITFTNHVRIGEQRLLLDELPEEQRRDIVNSITVKDNAGSPEAIEGAIVDVNGSRLKTNASGEAVFNLRPGTYPAKIKKTGYSKITETVTVVASAVTKDVTLIKNA